MAQLPEGMSITWLGHSTFIVEGPDGRYLLEAFVQSNPACPDELKDVGQIDVILVTHGHGDHISDVVELAKSTGAKVVCMPEVYGWLLRKGIETGVEMNKGGTVEVGGIKVHMTHAIHSGGLEDGEDIYPAGDPAGYVLEFSNGFKLYHAGDTCVFGDMALIAKLLAPDWAMLPIGDHYTMGPRSAAEAVRLLGVKTVIPMHYGTFPVLVGTPKELEEHASDVPGLTVFHINPGDRIG